MRFPQSGAGICEIGEGKGGDERGEGSGGPASRMWPSSFGIDISYLQGKSVYGAIPETLARHSKSFGCKYGSQGN